MSDKNTEQDEFEDSMITELAGTLAERPLPAIYASASRLTMGASQSRQTLSLANGSLPIIRSCVRGLAEHTINVKANYDCEVVDIIHYRPVNDVICETFVLVKRLDKQELDCIKLTPYCSMFKKFGFIYKSTETHKSLSVGDRLNAGEVLLDTPTKVDNDNQKAGVSLNTLVASHYATSEDGVMISESAAEKLGYNTFPKIEFQVKDSQHLLALFGEEGHKQPLPTPGTIIGEDNILAVRRQITPESGIQSLLAGNTILPSDDIFQDTGIAGATVIDIRVIRTRDLDFTDVPHMEQLNHLADIKCAYHQKILSSYWRHRGKGDAKLEVSPRLGSVVMLSTALAGRASRSKAGAAELMRKNVPLAPYQITITLSKKTKVSIAGKLTDDSSCKGVVCKIVPDKDMPKMKESNLVADICVAVEGRPNRMIASSDMTQTLCGASRMALLMLKQLIPMKGRETRDVSGVKLPQVKHRMRGLSAINDFSAIRQLLSDFYVTCGLNELAGSILNSDDNDVREFVAECLIHGVPLPLSITHLAKNNIESVFEAIDNSPFRPEEDHICYVNHHGVPEETIDKHMIAPIYYYVLEKDATDVSACSTPHQHVDGLLCTKPLSMSNKTPISTKPPSIISTDEMPVLAGSIGINLIELMDRLQSSKTIYDYYTAVLGADKPLNNTNLIDRRKTPYGGSRFGKQFQHFLYCYGREFKYTKQ